MDIDTEFTKRTFNKDYMVNYYNDVVNKFGLFKSELLLIEKYFNVNDTVLDLGCGAGRVSIGLYNKGYKNIFGVDISEKMIIKATENAAHITFITADAKSLPFKNDSIDKIIFSYNGLMLIPNYKDRLSVLKEIKRVIKKGGIFLFSTPFLDNKKDSFFWRNKLLKEPFDETVGDILIDEGDKQMVYIHIPFVNEIKRLITNSELKLVEQTRRLDLVEEDLSIEDHLDDNMLWVVKR